MVDGFEDPVGSSLPVEVPSPADSAAASGIPSATASVTRREATKLITLLFSSGFVSIAALLFNIVLTRKLSVADFGHIGVIRTGLDLLTVPAAFGMNACIAKFSADARLSEGERSNMLVTAILITLGTSIGTVVLGWLLLLWPGILPDPLALRTLRWMILGLPFIALFSTSIGYLQAVGRVRRLAVAQGGRSLVRLTLGSALVVIWGFGGWIASFFLVELIALGATLPPALRGVRGRWDAKYVKPFLSFSGYATTTLALAALLTGVDVMCLVHFHAEAEIIAHYKIATTIFMTTLLLPNTFIQARWSRMVAHAYDPEHMWIVLRRNTGYLMTLVIPAAILGYFVAPILPFIFGEGYEPSVQIFRWLLPAFVIHSAGKLSSNLVVGAGLMRAQLATSVATLTMNIVLNILLIPSMGVAGAVVATTGSVALKTALSPWVLRSYRKSGSGER